MRTGGFARLRGQTHLMRVRIRGIHAADVERERGTNHRRDRDEGVLGARRAQRLGAERREAVDLVGALACIGGFSLRTIQQLRRQHRRRQEREQDEPVERILNRQRSERRQKEIVEADEGRRREREAERTSTPRASALHHEEVAEGDVGGVQVRTNGDEKCRHDRQESEPRDPLEPGPIGEAAVARLLGDAARARAHGSFSNR